MNKKELEQLKNKLLELRKEVSGQLGLVKDSEMNTTAKEAAGDHSSYSYHMADQGTDNMEREKTFFYAQRDNHTLQEIDDAIERIENKTFGLCEVCESKINTERLEAMPMATLCIQCKSNEENNSRLNLFSAGETF